METIEAIFTRRSIRKYTKQKISDDKIETILRSAMQAPSARNQQIWRFIVIDNLSTLYDLSKSHRYWHMMDTATLGIAVCADLSNAKSMDYFEQDCSAATQNILLSAHALGLGAVWLGVHPSKERVNILRKILNIPSDIIPISLISLGVPNEEILPENRFDNNKVHYNEW